MARTQVVTIAARKGGLSKRTLATHLCIIAAAVGRPVLLFDTDPQKSLAWWWWLRHGETPALIECDARELPKIVPTARAEGVETCIVDKPPHAENSIGGAMRMFDLILIPTRPSPFHLAATLDLAKRIGRPALAVINHAPPRTGAAQPSIVTEVREMLAHMGATVADTVVVQLVALSDAIIRGAIVNEYEDDGRAAAEVAALWREVQSHLKS